MCLRLVLRLLGGGRLGRVGRRLRCVGSLPRLTGLHRLGVRSLTVALSLRRLLLRHTEIRLLMRRRPVRGLRRLREAVSAGRLGGEWGWGWGCGACAPGCGKP